MRCRESDQIENYMLGNLVEAEEQAFEAHCRNCLLCSRAVAELGNALLDLSSADDQASLEACFTEVQQEINAIKVAAQKPRRMLHRLRVAAGLAVLLGGGLWFSFSHARSDEPSMIVSWQLDGNLVTTDNDQPVVRAGMVFTVRNHNEGNWLAALRREDGRLVWEKPIGLTTRIVADEKQIYTGQFSAGIFSISALSVGDGSEEWTCDYAFEGRFPKSVRFQLADGRLNWIAARILRSFDTKNGSLVWETELNGSDESFAMPVSHQDCLLVVGSQHLYRLDRRTGVILEQQPHAERYNHYMEPKAVAAGARFFVSATTAKGKGRTICYSMENSQQLWSRPMGSVRNIQAMDGLLIVKNERLEAYRQQDGQLIWSVPIGGCYRVAFHNHNIFAIHNADQSDIIALNAKTGRRIKSVEISGQSCSGLLIDGQDGFLSTNEGQLIAMSL